LPSVERIEYFPEETGEILRTLFEEMAADAAERAEKAWRIRKAALACYWKAVSVYAWHARRLYRPASLLVRDKGKQAG
jgi:hypothetical protein